MPDRSLRNLLKVRHASVDAARAALTGALDIEQAASAAETSATHSIQAEMDAASAVNADDATVEALAAWLPEARLRQAAARDRRRTAEAATARARAALALARAAEAAVEGLIEERRRERHAEIDRQAQLALGEHMLIRRPDNHD